MSKLAKTLSKEIDKGTKKLDANVSKAVGMPEETKVSTDNYNYRSPTIIITEF